MTNYLLRFFLRNHDKKTGIAALCHSLYFTLKLKQDHQKKPTSLHPTPSCFFIPIISFTSSLPFAGAAYKVNEVIHFSFTAPSLFRSFLKIELLVIQTFRNRKIKNNDSFKKVRFTLKKVKLTFSKVSRVFRKISHSFFIPPSSYPTT